MAELYYYRTKRGKEVDFVWLDSRGERPLVQVCFSLKDPATKKREVSSLKQAMDELNTSESTIVTLEQEDILEHGDSTINIVPAWKFLLEE